MSVTRVSSWLDALRQCGILEPGTLDELLQESPQLAADAKGLAQELVKRQWLTSYQANQVLLGKGAELIVASYVIREPLGEGGIGQVFKARQQRMRRLVALKVIRPQLVTDPDVAKRFVREIEAASQLSHPNVVHAFDAGPIGPTFFLAMEYLEGIDLARLVKEKGPLPVARACDYMRQAALGLQHVRERGLVHRDIKPPNLLLCTTHGGQTAGSGVVKILDLGLARFQYKMNRSGKTTLVTTLGSSLMMGTPDYLAPEQALDFHTADIRADIYSLGCTLYYLLTGQPPFPGGSLPFKLLQHQQAEPPSVQKLRPDAPAQLDTILRRMLAKRPPDRYQLPAEVAAALSEIPADEPRIQTTPSKPRKVRSKPDAAAEATERSGTPNKSEPPVRRRMRRWPLIAALGLFLSLGVLFLAIGTDSNRQLAGTNGTAPGGPALGGGRKDPQTTPSGGDLALPAVVDLSRSPITRLEGGLHSVAFSPQGPRMAIGGYEGSVRIGRLVAGRMQDIMALQGHEKAIIRSLVFSPDGKLLATGSDDKSVRLWDLSTLQARRTVKQGSSARAVAFSPDGKTLAFGGDDCTISFLDTATGESREGFAERAPSGIFALSYAPDGRTLAVALAGGVVRLHDPATGRVQTTLTGHTDVVRSASFAKNGKLLVSASAKETIVWSVENGAVRLRCAGTAPALFAPDDPNLMATGGLAPRLWDVLSGKERITFQGQRVEVSGLAFAPNGRFLALGGWNGAIIWDVPPPGS